ncbi:MAG TPA: hypothetical protein VK629_05215 [Steroidobacteraceae bacterium]|nr:hypothetical protein [Steroidobacteraceae bacterium]
MMARVLLLSLLLAGCSTTVVDQPALVAVAPDPSGLSHAELIYGYRCKGCHEPATPGAPDRKELATYEQKEIFDAMSKGAMKALASGLTRQQMREMAVFLTKPAA